MVLLSRNILFQGSPESAGEMAGGHVRIESTVRTAYMQAGPSMLMGTVV